MQTDNTKMQTDNTKMQTDIKENYNEQNNGCIIAATLSKLSINAEDNVYDSDLYEDSDSDSDSDADGDELDTLNESFRLAYGSHDEEELEDTTCIMCSLVVKSRTSFCNASCEQNYLNNQLHTINFNNED